MVEFKALTVKHRHVIKNYLNVSISEKLTPIAIAYGGRLRHRTEVTCQN
ncbi:hypothetical protein [Nostoc sp. FACHB-133]|nr:hypothetical protein [Nostoc sp. FACHB-133]MBD2527749.1 hypothetical protein [Nostoc sp. FACHB-133]